MPPSRPVLEQYPKTDLGTSSPAIVGRARAELSLTFLLLLLPRPSLVCNSPCLDSSFHLPTEEYSIQISVILAIEIASRSRLLVITEHTSVTQIVLVTHQEFSHSTTIMRAIQVTEYVKVYEPSLSSSARITLLTANNQGTSGTRSCYTSYPFPVSDRLPD